MKKWISLVVALAAGVWGTLEWHPWSRNDDPADAADIPTALVEPRDIRFAVNAAGDIGPADQVSVRPQVNGLIKTLPVDIGDHVTKGQILFTLDDTDLQTERSSRLIEIQAAKIQLEKAQRDYERAKQLYANKLISQEVYQDSRTTYELAKNSLDAAEKALHLIEYQITLTKIVAPFDCTILTRPVSVGQAVSGSGGYNSGTEVMTIANLKDMIVTAHINQADVTRLRVGQSVDIQVDAVPGLNMTGIVERLAPQATIKNNIKGYDARVAIHNIDPRVRPGMTANLSIPVASATNSLAVPLAAVFTDENPDTVHTERYVFVKTTHGYQRTPVQVGVSDYDYAEVLNGLKAGEAVALELPPAESLTQLAQNPNSHPRDGRTQPPTRRRKGGSAPATRVVVAPPRTNTPAATVGVEIPAPASRTALKPATGIPPTEAARPAAGNPAAH